MGEMMHSAIMLITPEIAKEYLATNPRNRSIKAARLAKYKDDMLNGNWQLTHQGIAIDSNGMLVDGHHRLTAIAETGIPQKMYVTFNAPASEKMDIGSMRSDIDSLYMAGIVEKGSIESCNLTYPLVNFIIDESLGAGKSKKCTATNKHNVYVAMKDLVDPIIGIAKATNGKCNGKVKSSAVLYAMVCALKSGVSVEKLRKWFYIAHTGDYFVENNQYETKVGRCVLNFKNFMDVRGRIYMDKIADREEVVKKAMSSIRHFENNSIVTKIYGEFVYDKVTVEEGALHGTVEKGDEKIG